MEFIVNEQGCQQLAENIQTDINKIATLISEIEGKNSTLQSALGEDADTIAASVKTMNNALQGAQRSFSVVRADMTEYMARVHQAKVALH